MKKEKKSSTLEKKQVYLDLPTYRRMEEVFGKTTLTLLLQEKVETAICRLIKMVEADPHLLDGEQNIFRKEDTERHVVSLSIKREKHKALKDLASRMGISTAALVQRAILHEAEVRGL